MTLPHALEVPLEVPPQIVALHCAGRPALALQTRHGRAILSLQGAQLLSWRPTGQRDVFWLSSDCLPKPAPVRGGVPVCWPWFAKEGQPVSAVQHGPVRQAAWHVTALHRCSDDEISLRLEIACRPWRKNGRTCLSRCSSRVTEPTNMPWMTPRRRAATP